MGGSGRTAAEWLKDQLRGQQVDCVGRARDRYGRLLSVCYVRGESINERIVREGWALDFRRILDPAGGISGQARRHRHLARRVRAALGVARRTSLIGAQRDAGRGLESAPCSSTIRAMRDALESARSSDGTSDQRPPQSAA